MDITYDIWHNNISTNASTIKTIKKIKKEVVVENKDKKFKDIKKTIFFISDMRRIHL